MNFLITMAGNGTRFKEAGYKEKKWQLIAHGKSLLEWSLNSLPLHLCTKLILVHQTADSEELHALIKEKFPQIPVSFLSLGRQTRGQAETALMAGYLLNMDRGTLIYNIDTVFTSKKLEAALKSDVDGLLGSFTSSKPHFSYAKVKSNVVIEVKEKEVISNKALTGLYYFKNTQEFLSEASSMIKSGEMVNGEFYITPIIQRLVSKGKTFKLDACDKVWILGTPEEYKTFLAQKI